MLGHCILGSKNRKRDIALTNLNHSSFNVRRTVSRMCDPFMAERNILRLSFEEGDLYTPRLIALSYGLLLSVTLVIFSSISLDRGVLEKISPILPMDFGLLETSVSSLCALAAFFLALALTPNSQLEEIRPAHFRCYAAYAAVMSSIVVATLTLTVFFPSFFLYHVKELRIISLSQELLLLASGIILTKIAIDALKRRPPSLFGVPGYCLILIMSFAVWILFLEEISYGQHIIGWSTPAIFDGNIQFETNIHNFHTNKFEFIYYNVAMAVFIILPFIRQEIGRYFLKKTLFYIPSVRFGVYSLPMLCLFYESWTIIPYRIEWIFGMFVLILCLYKLPSGERFIAQGMSAVYVIGSCLILVLGANLIDGYEVEEMRELAICVSLFAYSLWLANGVKARSERPEPDEALRS